MVTRKRKAVDNTSTPQPPQKKLNFTAHSSSQQAVSQQQLDSLVMKYVVTSLSSLSTVEKQSFVDLVKALAPNMTVMTRKTMAVRMKQAHTEMAEKLMKELQDIKYVCTTADIWSTNRKSYLGMTVHWISDGNARQSRALALRRIKGSHTFDCIAGMICSVHEQFDLDVSKVVSTVTDNASNFKKAFECYTSCEDSDVDYDDDESEEHDVMYTDVNNIITTGETENSNLSIAQLPRHVRCACHSLNLVATTDIEPSKVGNQQYSRMYHVTMGKCQALWNLVSRSSKASDAVSQICSGTSVLIPCATRWNSMYDAVRRLVEFGDKLAQMLDELQLPKLNRSEVEFLKEYCKAMEPLASTLDQLQGDQNSYFGMLLPKLIQLRSRLNRMVCDGLQFCGPLISAQLTGISTRFKALLALDLHNMTDPTVKEAVLAAISHPQYKLKWIPPDRRDEFNQYFVDSVVRYIRDHYFCLHWLVTSTVAM